MIAYRSARKQTFGERLVKGPAGFRRLLERMGPTFIKIGQFLALRPDLVPQEYCDELMKLLDHVPPYPWAEAAAIITLELGAPPERIFASIAHAPIAAGSLAQTHLATLRDGSQVAVKVLRPGIAQQIDRDLKRARILSRLLKWSGATWIVTPREVVDELTGWLAQEIDLAHELENMTRLHALTRANAKQKVPRPYPEFSARRVLTAEFIPGIPFTDILALLRCQDIQGVHALGIDPEELGRNLLTAVLDQMFRYKFFHADVHPGNLLALPDNVVGFVDFGLCDSLDEVVREHQLRYLTAVYSHDIEAMFQGSHRNTSLRRTAPIGMLSVGTSSSRQART